MKYYKAILSLGLFISLCFSQNSLTTIKNLSKDERNNYPVLRKLETEAIVLLSNSDIEMLRKRGSEIKVLEQNVNNDSIYLLIGKCSEDDSTLSKYGQILHTFDYCKLYKTDESQIVTLQKLKLFFERLQIKQHTNKKRIDSNSRLIKINLNNKTLIENILSNISIDTLRNYVDQLQNYDTRTATSTTNKTTVCNDLKDILSEYCDSVYLESFSSSYGANIVGIKKGAIDSSLTKYCVIGAHMDAVSSGGPFKAAGADDNASGTAAVIECARVLKDFKLKNTVRFVLFNAEEVGILGSEAFANNMNSANHELIGGAITMDMIGHSSKTENTVILEGTTTVPENEDFVRNYAKDIVQTYTDLNIEYNLQGFGSDHVKFWPHDYVSILLIEQDWASNDSYHEDWDTLDCPKGLNDNKLFENITRTAIASICDLATPVDQVSLAQNKSFNTNCNIFNSIIQSDHSIQFNLSKSGTLSIYNMRGMKIAQLKSNSKDINGNFKYFWKTDSQKKGAYLIKFENINNKVAQKIIL